MNPLFHLGRYFKLLGSLLKSPEKFSVYWKQFLVEGISMGVGSVGIVALISIFMGAVSTIQTAYQLVSAFIPSSVIGSIVVNTGLLELAPTITAIVLAGKVGSQISSQLGTMRVTEQIDALEVMGINPAGYLILPKIIASLITVPLLVIIAAFLLTLGGITAGYLTGAVAPDDFILGARQYFEPFQARFMLYKAITFAFIISTVSSYTGFYTTGGAFEVGQSSTRAVVLSCTLILFSDYLLAQILL